MCTAKEILSRIVYHDLHLELFLGKGIRKWCLLNKYYLYLNIICTNYWKCEFFSRRIIIYLATNRKCHNVLSQPYKDRRNQESYYYRRRYRALSGWIFPKVLRYRIDVVKVTMVSAVTMRRPVFQACRIRHGMSNIILLESTSEQVRVGTCERYKKIS